MDAVLRAIGMYMFLLLLFRLGGKRAVAQITTFDFVLLVIIGEASQQALLGNDFSMTDAFLVILTLLLLNIGMSVWQARSKAFKRLIDGTPIVIVDDGQPLRDRMDKLRVGEDDVLEAARELQGLERMDQIKYAVMERTGSISIVPKQAA